MNLRETIMEEILESELPWGGTLRDFMAGCLFGLWDSESFNGKRPGVDSGWHITIAELLSRLDHSIGLHDSNGYFNINDWKAANNAYKEVIEYVLRRR